MDTIKKEMLEFLEEQKQVSEKQIEDLNNDNRADEARFYKAKANIYDVFKALFEVSFNQANGDIEKLEQLFLAKSEAVPASWKKSLEQAQIHEDAEKILMEETKLSAAQQIVQQFNQIVLDKQ